jgi:hypothetical protein
LPEPGGCFKVFVLQKLCQQKSLISGICCNRSDRKVTNHNHKQHQALQLTVRTITMAMTTTATTKMTTFLRMPRSPLIFGMLKSINAEESTANDEAITRAIAENDEHSQARTNNNVLNCPGKHGLQQFVALNSQRVSCNGCQKNVWPGGSVRSCVECNCDYCESCFVRGNPSSATATLQTSSHEDRICDRRISPHLMPNFATPSQQPNHFGIASSTHMCIIPCTIRDITVEMLVDTGAQSLIISAPLVMQLGLSNRLNTRYQGVAAGVGRAIILGRIQNVVCAFGNGHVEFLMDFMMLDITELLVIIGLDQLHKYKCLVDVGSGRLISGGTGGITVEMLPPNASQFDVNFFNHRYILM